MLESNIDQLPLIHDSTGNQTLNPGMCLTRNRTSSLSLCGQMPNQLSLTGQGKKMVFLSNQVPNTIYLF